MASTTLELIELVVLKKAYFKCGEILSEVGRDANDVGSMYSVFDKTLTGDLDNCLKELGVNLYELKVLLNAIEKLRGSCEKERKDLLEELVLLVCDSDILTQDEIFSSDLSMTATNVFARIIYQKEYLEEIIGDEKGIIEEELSAEELKKVYNSLRTGVAQEKQAEEAILFYIQNNSVGNEVGDKFYTIHSILSSENKSVAEKMGVLASSKRLMEEIKGANECTKKEAAEKVVAALQEEVTAYIQKKSGQNVESQKVNTARQMAETLKSDDLSSIEKLSSIKSLIEEKPGLLEHRNTIKRKAENFLGRVAKLIDGFFSRSTANADSQSQVSEKTSGKSGPTRFMFFKQPDSRELVGRMVGELSTFESRVVKLPRVA